MDTKPPTEYDRFNRLVGHVLSVPKAEIDKRENEYRKAPESKRSPTRKASSPASAS